MEHRNYPLLTAAVLLFIAQACLAQTPFADTPAGNQAKAWLEVFNAGDAEKHKEFLRKNAPTRLERADREIGLRAMSGGFDVKKVEESTPTKIVALVQERASDEFVRFTVEVDAGEQHQITRLALQGTARPSEFALRHLSESELITAVRKKLDEAADDRFSGAALVARNGKTVFAQAYGLNRSRKENCEHFEDALSTRINEQNVHRGCYPSIGAKWQTRSQSTLRQLPDRLSE
ncbi:MAG: hypothetical protein ACR2G5_16670 [Pyrinomonadaceae bacterium]